MPDGPNDHYRVVYAGTLWDQYLSAVPWPAEELCALQVFYVVKISDQEAPDELVTLAWHCGV